MIQIWTKLQKTSSQKLPLSQDFTETGYHPFNAHCSQTAHLIWDAMITLGFCILCAYYVVTSIIRRGGWVMDLLIGEAALKPLEKNSCDTETYTLSPWWELGIISRPHKKVPYMVRVTALEVSFLPFYSPPDPAGICQPAPYCNGLQPYK